MLAKINCYAKINLGLKVLGRRADGFHELETTMHEIDLCDHLEIEFAGEKDRLEIAGLDLPVEDDNLLFQCLQRVRAQGIDIPPLSMKLHKHIPMGGGLGGGSSDAIALLRWLSDDYEISEGLVDKIAADLGSDTNFFIQGETALCRGRGERIEQLEQRHLKLLLILPPWSCSTPKVFSALKSDDWKSDARNHLAEACCRAYPEMQQLMKELSHHQVHAELSGSGSTLYVDQDSLGSLDQSYQTLLEHFEHCKVIKVESYHRCESE